MRLRVRCPAKINTFLSVGPKDARGYHPLRTHFQAVGLFDELTIETGLAANKVTSDWSELPQDNTVMRALKLVSEIAPVPAVHVHIQKRIPAQSGLGGGSSDAAGVLRAVPLLIGAALNEPELQSVALAVGADVPFFLLGGRAKAEGYGEKLTPLADSETRWLLIARPDVDCPTGPMFAKLDEKSYAWRDFPNDETLYNDFERVAPCECIELIERLQAIGAEAAGLTGSGSATFGYFPNRTSAEQAERRLHSESRAETWVVPTLSRQESLLIETE